MKIGKLIETKSIVEELYEVIIETAECSFSRPGQYALIKIPGTEYEEAFPVCEYDSKRFTVVVKADNDYKRLFVGLPIETELDVETGLGNGFDIDAIPDGSVLVADTSGIPQMLGIMRGLIMQGKEYSLVIGYSTKARSYMLDKFSTLCNNIEVLTLDGSNGRQGTADDGVRKAEYVCAAGSVNMLDRLAKKAEHGQYSLDGMNVTSW